MYLKKRKNVPQQMNSKAQDAALGGLEEVHNKKSRISQVILRPSIHHNLLQKRYGRKMRSLETKQLRSQLRGNSPPYRSWIKYSELITKTSYRNGLMNSSLNTLTRVKDISKRELITKYSSIVSCKNQQTTKQRIRNSQHRK